MVTQVVGDEAPSTATTPLSQEREPRFRTNAAARPAPLIQLFRRMAGIKPPGTVTAKVPSPTTQVVGGGSPPPQSPTPALVSFRQPSGVVSAASSTSAIRSGLRGLRAPVGAVTREPARGGSSARRGGGVTRALPRRPRATPTAAPLDRFQVALAERQARGLSPDNPRDLRKRVANLQTTFS